MNRSNAILRRFEPNQKIVGAEIGVYKGSLSKMLLQKNENLFLYMIDRWKAYSLKEIKANKGSSMSLRDQSVFNAAYSRAKIINKIYPHRSKIIKKNSVKAARKIKNQSLDFAFQDADHSEEVLKKDIKIWLPKIKPGGYICGHDYHRESVKAAVKYYFDEMMIEEDVDNTWFVRVM
jgi:hypothetical protein